MNVGGKNADELTARRSPARRLTTAAETDDRDFHGSLLSAVFGGVKWRYQVAINGGTPHSPPAITAGRPLANVWTWSAHSTSAARTSFS